MSIKIKFEAKNKHFGNIVNLLIKKLSKVKFNAQLSQNNEF